MVALTKEEYNKLEPKKAKKEGTIYLITEGATSTFVEGTRKDARFRLLTVVGVSLIIAGFAF
jgi:hypothetical protein